MWYNWGRKSRFSFNFITYFYKNKIYSVTHQTATCTGKL